MLSTRVVMSEGRSACIRIFVLLLPSLAQKSTIWPTSVGCESHELGLYLGMVCSPL